MKKWERIESKTIFGTPWITLKCEKCITERGVLIPDYYWIEDGDYVEIFGTTVDGKVVLVEQYRLAVDEVTLETPAGRVENGKDVNYTAKHELEEETGYTTDQIEFQKIIYTDTGRSTAKGYLFFARNLTKLESQNLDETEDINVKLFDFDQLQELIDSNTIKAASVLTICLLALQNKNWFLSK